MSGCVWPGKPPSWGLVTLAAKGPPSAAGASTPRPLQGTARLRQRRLSGLNPQDPYFPIWREGPAGMWQLLPIKTGRHCGHKLFLQVLRVYWRVGWGGIWSDWGGGRRRISSRASDLRVVFQGPERPRKRRVPSCAGQALTDAVVHTSGAWPPSLLLPP